MLWSLIILKLEVWNMPMKHNFKDSHPYILKCNTFQDSMRHPCIFVEGNNDMIVYNEVINSGWYFFPSAKKIKDKGVKENIIELIKNRNTTKTFQKNFVGIIDKDYDEPLQIKNLYYTDYNDLESSALMVMSIEEIYHGLDLVLKNTKFEEFESFYKKALDIAIKLSNLWKYIYSINTNNFLTIKYLINYFDKKEYLFLSKVLDNNYNINYLKILELYNEYTYFFRDYILNDLVKIMKQYSNEFRGHDLFFVLGFILHKEGIISWEDYSNLEIQFIKRTNDLIWIKRTKLYENVKNAKAFK